MRIFNSDGYEASFCGNGLRCLVAYIQTIDKEKQKLTIETADRVLCCSFHLDKVTVNMPLPASISVEEIDGYSLYLINTGVPHAVFFTDDIQAVFLEEIGRKIRFHPHFAPSGVNVNCIQQIDNHLHIRTYERGVEAETLSCGSGAAAAAFLVREKNNSLDPITVIPASKDPLQFTFTGSQMQMIGPAYFVFCGSIQYESFV